MEFQKVLETRRSVRKYDPNVSVTREQMEELIRAAQEAPSWKNSQTGRYYCVLSEEIVNKIRKIVFRAQEMQKNPNMLR